MPYRSPITTAEELAERVDASGDCWLWLGKQDYQGYCHVQGGSAHRFVYQSLVGPIPRGLTLDHLCRVRHCVNPDHLEVVTQRVNTLRGYGVAGLSARADRCRAGHCFDEANTRIARNARVCRTCEREYDRRKRRRKGLPTRQEYIASRFPKTYTGFEPGLEEE